MTRKDYDLIAACIRGQLILEQDCDNSEIGAEVIHEFARRVASELLNTNPRFDMSRFLIACGVMEKTKA